MRLVLVLAVLASTVIAQPRQPGWEVRVPDKISITSGQTGSIEVAIAVDRGLSVSKDASVIIDLAAPPGVAIRKKRLGRGDAVDPEADAPRFAVPVKAEAAGDHAVTVRVRFWLCGGKACRPIDVRRQTTITVPVADAGSGS